ncbi:hypothetical protein OX283_009325 [Flavobacterium sp. SUN052]|uniref:hypothetical protein n=1 Tax=Flavobacterium sp. SUN052 TaxID=3002441 RepID=UPI00237E4132|nr:hypothetical protein [Flavobacterium sp. SUN052]MEC4004854.1 hypothetical protein [Flavobacterium sp. SUN052]
MGNYKKISILLVFVLLFVCCANKLKKHTNSSNHEVLTVSKDSVPLVFHKLSKLYVIGNFEGKGKKDTIFQYNFSGKNKTEIMNAPDPFKNDWDVVEKWFYDQKADVLLQFKSSKKEVLHLGIAHGLYCLLNIGDNNNDGKDEIALVIDKLDESRVNTCKIYSYCDGKWNVLKQFDVFEDVFDFKSGNDTPQNFTFIKGFLEKEDGKWLYKDYSQNEYDNPNDVGKLLPLNISKCD